MSRSGYVERPELEIVIDELAALFDGGAIDPELVADARAYIADNDLKLFRLVIGGRSALSTNIIGSACPRFEPTERLLRLVAAVRANSRDQLARVIHEFRS